VRRRNASSAFVRSKSSSVLVARGMAGNRSLSGSVSPRLSVLQSGRSAVERICSYELRESCLSPCAPSAAEWLEGLKHNAGSSRFSEGRVSTERRATASPSERARDPTQDARLLYSLADKRMNSTLPRTVSDFGRLGGGRTVGQQKPTVGRSKQCPNPSIERTVTSGLRPLVTAAHVKR